MTFKAFSIWTQGRAAEVLRPAVWTLAFLSGLTAFNTYAETVPAKPGATPQKPAALCSISHANSKLPQTCPTPVQASTDVSPSPSAAASLDATKSFVARPLHARTPQAPVTLATRRAWIKTHAPLPTGIGPDDAVAMTAQNPGTTIASAAQASPGVVALAIRDKAQELLAPKPEAKDNDASGEPHSQMAQTMSMRATASATDAQKASAGNSAGDDAATPSALKSKTEDLSAPKPQATAEPQVTPMPMSNRGQTQTRGMASGQDVASLGLANESSFSVKGLGAGQSLSAFDVAMPALVHQILANDVAKGGVSEAAPPPEETTPDFLERVTLSRQLMQVDGTDDLIRHLVNTVHMKLIVGEVNKYLNINSLAERDRYRLSAIVASTATELSDRILNLNARTQARLLSKAELQELIVALDLEPQKKLTRLRLGDDGTLDKQAELEIQLAQLQIIKSFERK